MDGRSNSPLIEYNFHYIENNPMVLNYINSNFPHKIYKKTHHYKFLKGIRKFHYSKLILSHIVNNLKVLTYKKGKIVHKKHTKNYTNMYLLHKYMLQRLK
jgi:hypothetical protein